MVNPHQALAAFSSMATTTAPYTVCSAASHSPRVRAEHSRSVQSLSTGTDDVLHVADELTDSLLETATPRMFSDDARAMSASRGGGSDCSSDALEVYFDTLCGSTEGCSSRPTPSHCLSPPLCCEHLTP